MLPEVGGADGSFILVVGLVVFTKRNPIGSREFFQDGFRSGYTGRQISVDKTPGWKDPPFLAPSFDIEEAGQDWLTFNLRVAGVQSMPTDMQSCGSVGVQLGQEGMA